MTEENLRKLIDELRVLPSETEWVEFKENRCEKNELGEYISALANSACLHNKRTTGAVHEFMSFFSAEVERRKIFSLQFFNKYVNILL